jgi:hypothetical protein
VTPYEAAQGIPWTRRQRAFTDLDMMSQILAISETAAHLEVLVLRGHLVRHSGQAAADSYALPGSP